MKASTSTLRTLLRDRLLPRLSACLEAIRDGLRRQATVDRGVVYCPHCGSHDVYYSETVGHFGRFSLGPGSETLVFGTDLHIAEQADDPHVECFDCGRWSRCPPFEWA